MLRTYRSKKKCKFCQKEFDKLANSHVFPKSFYKDRDKGRYVQQVLDGDSKVFSLPAKMTKTLKKFIVYNAKSLQSCYGISVQFSDGRAVATINHIDHVE